MYDKGKIVLFQEHNLGEALVQAVAKIRNKNYLEKQTKFMEEKSSKDY